MERHHKILEALNFFKKKGPVYVKDFASLEERKYFLGILYKADGTPDQTKIKELLQAA